MTPFLIGFVALMTMATSANIPNDYREEIAAWQQHRDKGLRSPDGWLTLVGLFWLKQGDNTIGSGEGNDFVLPTGSASAAVAKIKLEGGTVTLTNLAGDHLEVNHKPVAGVTVLKYPDDNPDTVSVDRISFFVIKRGERLALRVRDKQNPVLEHFTGMKYFPVDPAYRIEAKFIPDEHKIPVPNILGETELETSPGIVEFTLQGQTFRMRPIYEGKTLFFIFKDLTSKTETYQAGRMLNTPLPADGKVVLDFNRSYNPPCTFTPYATCPLPLKENVLGIRIEAGELRYGSGHPE
jgi:uncharacterized protein